MPYLCVMINVVVYVCVCVCVLMWTVHSEAISHKLWLLLLLLRTLLKMSGQLFQCCQPA